MGFYGNPPLSPSGQVAAFALCLALVLEEHWIKRPEVSRVTYLTPDPWDPAVKVDLGLKFNIRPDGGSKEQQF